MEAKRERQRKEGEIGGEKVGFDSTEPDPRMTDETEPGTARSTESSEEVL
jgi:hypothetical protein